MPIADVRQNVVEDREEDEGIRCKENGEKHCEGREEC